jgi:hypothetical protein
VLAGWVLGFAIIGIYWAGGPAVERWLARQRLSTHLFLALAVPLALFMTHAVKGTASQTGALAGVGVGLALTRRHVPFAAGGPVWQRALRFLTGGVFAVALYLGLRIAFPAEGSALYLGFRILRYGLIGLWIGVGAPWLFRQLHLVDAGGRAALAPPSALR